MQKGDDPIVVAPYRSGVPMAAKIFYFSHLCWPS